MMAKALKMTCMVREFLIYNTHQLFLSLCLPVLLCSVVQGGGTPPRPVVDSGPLQSGCQGHEEAGRGSTSRLEVQGYC